ncbi:MAG: sensor histidine kinase [Methanomicrobiales archaeon]
MIEVNQRTLDIYKAGDISEFRDYLPYIFTLESIETFKDELISIAEGKTCFMSESVTKTLDGDKNYIMLKFNVSPGYEKDYSRVIISIIDLTKRKLMEDELKKVMSKNEMLLKEIHHRVKNNLQIISSILNLQSFYLTDKKSLEALTDCKNRVRSMGMVHEKLYQSGDFAKIEVKDYIESVALEIFKSYALNPEQIKVKMEIEDISLDINQSIAIGLIVNELLTNSIKYAFPQKKGNIEIKISKKGDDKISMLIQDDGIGFPADFELVKSETLGLQLVNNLVSQLDGEITLDRSSGTKFIIEFPLI